MWGQWPLTSQRYTTVHSVYICAIVSNFVNFSSYCSYFLKICVRNCWHCAATVSTQISVVVHISNTILRYLLFFLFCLSSCSFLRLRDFTLLHNEPRAAQQEYYQRCRIRTQDYFLYFFTNEAPHSCNNEPQLLHWWLFIFPLMSHHISKLWATVSPTNEPPHLQLMSHHISN